MTKKDYQIIAQALLQARLAFKTNSHLIGVDVARELIAQALARENPRFDFNKFVKMAIGEAK